MTTLGSWIDDEALAQVLSELCPEPKPLPTQSSPTSDTQPSADELDGEPVPLDSLPPSLPSASASEAETTSAHPAPAAAVVERLAALKERAERSGLIPGLGSGAGSATSRPFVMPETNSVIERLAALEQWILAECRARHVCLADQSGEPLTVVGTAIAGLAAASALLADALVRSRTEAGLALGSALHSPLRPGEVLTTIAIEAAEGLFSISTIGAAPLSPRDTARFAEAFLHAIGSQKGN